MQIQQTEEYFPEPKRMRYSQRKTGQCIDCGGPCVGKAVRCLDCRRLHRQERELTVRSEEWRRFCRWAW